MRLNAILFQAAALTIAASPALASSHGSKKRMAQHVKVPRANKGTDKGFLGGIVPGVIDAAGPIIATVYETAQAPQQSIVYVTAQAPKPQVVTITEVIPAGGITFVETVSAGGKTVTHTAPPNGVTRTETSPNGQATTRAFGPGEVVTQTLQGGATYTRLIQAGTTITENLPAPAAETVTVVVPGSGAPYTFYVEDGSGSGDQTVEVYQPGETAVLTIPAPAQPSVVVEVAGASPLTITEYILGEDRTVVIPAGQTVTHTLPPDSVETARAAPLNQALTYTQTVFGQVVTRTVPAGQTITNVIPRPTPTGPTIVYVTEDPGSNQPVTVTEQAPQPSVVTVYVTEAGQVEQTAVPAPTGNTGDVKTITITLLDQEVVTKTITLGKAEPSPPSVVTVYVTDAGQVVQTTVPAPTGAPGAVKTITLTLPDQETITKTITLGSPESSPAPVVVTQTQPAGPISTVLPPTPAGECPPSVDLLCGNADPSKSSIEADIITGAFDIITSLSANLTDVVKTLDFFNAPAVVFQIVPGFSKIIATITADAGALGGPDMAPVGCGDADAIVIALSDFVEVHQALLGVVIGKRGLLNQVPGLQIAVLPINAVLVVLEGIVDTIAGIVIGFIPSRSCEATKKVDALRNSVVAAQQAFTL